MDDPRPDVLGLLEPEEEVLAFTWARVPGSRTSGTTFASILALIVTFDFLRNRIAMRHLKAIATARPSARKTYGDVRYESATSRLGRRSVSPTCRTFAFRPSPIADHLREPSLRRRGTLAHDSAANGGGSPHSSPGSNECSRITYLRPGELI